ncbi:diguanylate cyclase [Rhodospirillum rubrum F11]|uniref:diguanylate cyclase n=1 Tax=Rhodospirillum rubrum (strain ATCC 11170 / ATH 1.1.1 / DSM 467 / LMG 4362 / NCIMB 8255 / S1) TaxID=269796 RepID=Q2RR54_RHORT|nr:diguanylate cyclase [Rhodospirillum rubrum]ABC23391.1 Putative diguanylate cyclase (GGDEF domain) [Rhodospirillum rubrum ATCC 11170]AEO49127.1 diguanylate cyclase [Rhodospirillum rubrum F11]MBK5955041.1 diguanylate cyclase [Rhodospirillum rubrum]QXG79364.1 sensor domain-containing diguanylate cyclase [Rhodospirillum rubrum]HCF18966.1 GGDEF domain-containing protein [Rhodospirillum rubrum]
MLALTRLLLLVLVVACATPAFAEERGADHILARAFLEDPAGVLTIDEVARGDFTPFGPNFSKGYTQSVYWVRLLVRASAAPEKTVLFIRPSFLNEVRLFYRDRASPDGWATRVSGNRYPFSERDRKSVALGFVVDVTHPQEEFYLRIKTNTQMQIDVQAVSPDVAADTDSRRDMVMVFFVTSMILMIFWGVNEYSFDRYRIFALFCIHQLAFTLFGISAVGYFSPFWVMIFPGIVDRAFYFLYMSISFTLILFCRELFKPYQPHPVLAKGLDLARWAFPLQIIALIAGYDALAVISNALLIKGALFYFVFVAFSLKVDLDPTRRTLRIFFIGIALINLIFWMTPRVGGELKWLGLSAVQALVIDGFVMGILFAWLAHGRGRQVREDAQRKIRLVKESYLAERDLKARAEREARVDYLTGVLNRRSFFELAEGELARSIRFGRPLAVLMIDIDYFKAVNDTWGHGVGDEVLQNVAGLIGQTLRGADIFGRTGGEEFTAVIVEASGSEALEVAQRLCAVVAQGKIVGPGGEAIGVTLSIGVSLLRGRDMAFEILSREADQAMYGAKRAGRNRVVVHRDAWGALG